MIVEHALAVGRAHIPAEAENGCFDQLAIRAGGGESGNADVVDRQSSGGAAIPGDGGDGAVAVGIGCQITPLIGACVGVDHRHLDGRGGITAAGQGDLSPGEQGDQIIGIAGEGVADVEGAQLGDHRPIRSVELGQIIGIHRSPAAGLVGAGLIDAVVDALVAVNGVHERLKILFTIAAGDGYHRLGGLHPSHQGVALEFAGARTGGRTCDRDGRRSAGSGEAGKIAVIVSIDIIRFYTCANAAACGGIEEPAGRG